MAAEPFAGFLPEPIPPVLMTEAEIEKQLDTLQNIAAASQLDNSTLYHALLTAPKRRRVVDGILTKLIGEPIMRLISQRSELREAVEQSYDAVIVCSLPTVPDDARTVLLDELTALALRTMTPTPLGLPEAMADVRQFSALLTELIAVIIGRLDLTRHGPDIYICMLHPDVPDAEGFEIILDYGEVWDDSRQATAQETHIVTIQPWVGRHAAIRAWHDFVYVLARELNTKCDFSH